MKRTLEMKLLSFVLTLIMVFVSYVAMPVKALAEEAEEAEQIEAIEAYADANDFSQDNSLAYSPLVGELREDRDESIKVFRRADGAKEAVVYSDPIHYLKDEAWETIDNTLELVTLEDGTQVYRNKANDFIVSFSPHFNADNLITVESKGHILSWRFTEEVPFVLEEFVNVEETQIEETEPEEAEQEEEQPVEESEETELVEEPAEEQDDQEAISDESETMEDQEELTAEETETSIEETEPEEAEQEEEQPVEESEETELAEEPAEEQDDQEAISDEPETMEDQEELTAEETETSIEEAEPEEPEQEEEQPVEESEEEEPEETEGEPVYETLKITDAEAEIAEREHKEPETDRERDMLLRYPEELTSELTYKDSETGLNVHYVLSGKRLSEQIVLDHVPETGVAYTTLLTTNGLKAEERDGRIVFVDENDEAVFEILPPVMYDENGEESAEIEVQLIEMEDGYAYTLIPDEKWLKDETRAYPIFIDPDIRDAFATSVSDTYVESANPDTNRGTSGRLYAASSAYYSLIRIDSFASLKSGDIILNATMHLTRRTDETNNNNITVTGHRITSEWLESTVTYNDMPSYESNASTMAITGHEGRIADFDITSLVKEWYNGTSANNGILLKAYGYASFHSTNCNSSSALRPSFSVIYRNSTGLESNWTYYSQSAGRAGTGSVNLASGNLTWTLPDGGITNGALPISLSHVYNVNDIESDLGYGRGWRLNYAQTLKLYSIPNGNETTVYYEYTDGDGTRHYYKDLDGEYVNELDKYSKLTFSDNGATATITDKGDNKLVFEIFTTGSGAGLQKNGRLIRIEDANGNQTLITYKNPTGWSLRISMITEQLSGLSAGQSMELQYDMSSNHLEKIIAPNGLDIDFSYSAGNDLVSAQYTDDNSIAFDYSNHRLTKATNIDAYNLRYTYNSQNGIQAVTEYAGSTAGQHLLFGYGRNKTVVTDSQGRKTIYILDSLGQPISVMDAEGRAMFAAYNQAEQTVTQLSAVSKLQNTTVNLLGNHGFERSSWDITPWTPSDANLITVNANQKKDGYFSAKFAAYTQELTLSQTVSVTAGKTYTLSAYYKGAGRAQVKAVTGTSTFAGEVAAFTADEWKRTSVTFTATADSVTVYLMTPENSADMYVDSVQLERAPTPNRYNLLENSDFSNGTTRYEQSDPDRNSVVSVPQGNRPAAIDNHALKLTRFMGVTTVSQRFLVNGHAGDTYSFGGWMKSTCPPESQQPLGQLNGNNIWVDQYYPTGVKELKVEFLGINANQEDVFLSGTSLRFAADTTEWQYACGVAVAQSNYSQIRISFVLTRCIGETMIDGLQLYREEFSQAYAYDSSGNMTGYTTLIGQQNSFEYDDTTNNLTSSTDPRGNTTTYEYDTKHNVTSVTSPLGVKAKYTVNAKGQVYRTRVGTDSEYIETITEHGGAAALLTKTIDSRGKQIEYGYDNPDTRLNTDITDPAGHTTHYVYGDEETMLRLEEIQAPDGGVVRYGYDAYGVLETIEVGEYDNDDWVLHNRYLLTYDDWNRPETTRVGEEESEATLSTNTYYDDGKLKKVVYTNGLTARYVYDDLDRVSRIYQKEGNNQEKLTYEMIYNGEGDLYELRNFRTNRASFFEYDHAGRCMASKERAFTFTENNGVYTIQSYGAIVSSYKYEYDVCNNLSKLTCSVLSSTWSTVYTYDDDNRPFKTKLSSGIILTNVYDALGRIHKRKIGLNTNVDTVLTYEPGNSSSKKTGLVATYQNGSDAAYSYTYDDNSNILSITQGTTSISYEYDEANRLIRENNSILNQTITYAYDFYGNILNKKIYAYTTIDTDLLPTLTPIDTIGYTYNSTDWTDQLVQYGNETISYDEMGNPTTYRGYTFGWRGKQLVSASNGTNSLTFAYNEDGLRQSKTCNNIMTDYYYNGSVLIGMQRGTAKLLFSYDAGGNVISVRYITANDTNEYYYLRNTQGDIVKLIDANGVSVVEYTYDTWGKKVTTTGTLAGTLGLFQPFRYRGYVYDWETGFYYLQSRYYDPTTGRFISADVLLSTGQGVLGHNCYAYCLGNPGNKIDTNGNDAIWIQEGGSAYYAGHSGLMVQDENGDWYYFFWGPKDESFSWDMIFGGKECGAYVVKLGVDDINDIQDVKAALTNCNDPNDPDNSERARDRAGKVTSVYYFKGDYSDTYAAVVRYAKEAEAGNKYNLIVDNCVERTLSAFMASDWRFALVISEDPFCDIVPNLVVSRVALLPSNKDRFPFLLFLTDCLDLAL